MKKVCILTLISLFFAGLISCGPKQPKGEITIKEQVLRDKIAGGWAGKMIGVTYGAPTEFVAKGRTYEEPINWKPSDVIGSLTQDDIYVQLTFMETMDKYGMDAPAKKFQELFAKAGYHLWHANVQARKNYFDSIFPPQSGHPDYNLHADDIDFQIEADYLGFMCPAMPQTATKMSDKIGHIMNYGDGVYGGVFVAAMYAEAYINDDVKQIIDKALLSIPAESAYSKIVKDVILLHQQYPSDWRKAWQELENKWGKVQICEAGTNFNIDAKLNGAYIVMGLLYGEGDVDKTMEISTRCGQDSDCNPSNAVAVLGIIKGLSGLPEAYQQAVKAMGDSIFIFTPYSFNKAVDRTLYYAKEIALQNGGNISNEIVTIKTQKPTPMAMEDAFPNLVLGKRENTYAASFQTKGEWQENEEGKYKFSTKAGSEISYTFDGTGVSIMGNWIRNGGMADVYVDGEFKRTIDCYFFHSNQEQYGINLFHILGLPKGKHTVKLVVKEEKNKDSQGSTILITGATVYQTGPKICDNFKFSFQ